MLDFAKLLQSELSTITKECFHEKNRKDKVVYPYLTYDYDRENVTRERDEITIEIDIFDFNTSYKRVLELEEQIKRHFNGLLKLTEDLYVNFRFVGSNKVNTGSDTVKRRNIRLNVQTEWRK